MQLTGLSVVLRDDQDMVIGAAEVLDAIRVKKGQYQFGSLENFLAGDTLLQIDMEVAPVVHPTEAETLTVEIDLTEYPGIPSFQLQIPDSTCFSVRDLSSGTVLPIVGDVDSLIAESAFPMQSGIAHMKAPAMPPDLCLNASLPASVVGGADLVPLVEMRIDYSAGNTENSSLWLQEMRLIIVDSLDRPLDPYRLFDRIGYDLDGAVTYQPTFSMSSGQVVFEFGDDGIVVDPGTDVSIRLLADIDSDVPFDNFRVELPEDRGIGLLDATDPTRHPGFSLDAACADAIPLISGIAHIYLPSGQPVVEMTIPQTTIARIGQKDVVPLAGVIHYNTDSPKGDLLLNALTCAAIMRTKSGETQVDPVSLFDRVTLLVDEIVVATDSVYDGGNVSLELQQPSVISRGGDVRFAILCDISPRAEEGNYYFEFLDSNSLAFSDKNLSTDISPILSGATYPIRSAEMSVRGASLVASFTNYPNPFDPNIDGETTIGFVLTDAARVDLEIYSITGDLVKQLLTGVSFDAGNYTDTKWTGRNDAGYDVLPGAYICQIKVQYQSGQSEVLRRKVAITR